MNIFEAVEYFGISLKLVKKQNFLRWFKMKLEHFMPYNL